MDKQTRETIRILKKARRLISKPERWTKHFFACDSDGAEVEVGSPRAACFCALGAMVRGGSPDAERGEGPVFDAFAHGLRRRNVDHWNDQPHRKHSDVLRRFDRTIARLEGKVRNG